MFQEETMMFANCPACGLDAVHDDGPFKYTCTCEECGAKFTLDCDADFDGENFTDASSVGDPIDM